MPGAPCGARGWSRQSNPYSRLADFGADEHLVVEALRVGRAPKLTIAHPQNPISSWRLTAVVIALYSVAFVSAASSARSRTPGATKASPGADQAADLYGKEGKRVLSFFMMVTCRCIRK